VWRGNATEKEIKNGRQYKERYADIKEKKVKKRYSRKRKGSGRERKK
jgi:hypothetical protein